MNALSHSRMTLLWWCIFIVALCMGLGGLWMHNRYYDDAFSKAMHDAERANNAAVEHSMQVIGQADTLLRAVREFYLRTGSIAETEDFIARLEIHSPLIEGIFLIDADGLIAIPSGERQRGLNNSQREHFLYHKEETQDLLYLTPVSRGQATGKEQFRASRRISSADGRFLGEVLIPLEPKDFSRRFQQLISGTDAFASLIGTTDRLLRARSPEPPRTPGRSRSPHRSGTNWPKPKRAVIATRAASTASSGAHSSVRSAICRWSWLLASLTATCNSKRYARSFRWPLRRQPP